VCKNRVISLVVFLDIRQNATCRVVSFLAHLVCVISNDNEGGGGLQK